MVVFNHWSFTIEDTDCDDGLLVLVGCEDLTLLGWDNCTSWNDFGHNTTNGFNT